MKVGDSLFRKRGASIRVTKQNAYLTREANKKLLDFFQKELERLKREFDSLD
jgi:hypothetical protein